MLGKIFNAVGGLFGMGGGQGDYYQAPPLKSKGKERLDTAISMSTQADVKDIISKLSKGEAKLSDVVAAADKTGDEGAALQAIASSPIGGSSLATQQVKEDAILGDLFRDGGSMDRAAAEEGNLASRGYSLQPEDYEAYGQASGNVARMFGKQEQSLGQALAARGLASGNNGTTQATFTNLMGNKAEQLGQLQRQIADDRMSKNLERLTATRNYLTGLGSLGTAAQGQFYDQNQTSAQRDLDIYGKDISAYTAEQQAAQASAQSKKDNEKLGLGDAITSGLFTGVSGGVSSKIGSLFGGAKSSDDSTETKSGGSAASLKRKGVF